MSLHVKVPHDEFMTVIEYYLNQKGLVNPDEFIVMIDLGYPVDDYGMIELEMEIRDVLPEPELITSRDGEVEEISKDTNVVDMAKYRSKQKQIELFEEDVIDEL